MNSKEMKTETGTKTWLYMILMKVKKGVVQKVFPKMKILNQD